MGLLRSSAIGHLTADPKIKKVNIGGDEVTVCEFSVAVNYGFKDNKKTEYINVVAWRKLGEIIGEHFTSGRKIYIEGKQQTRDYIDTRYKNDAGDSPKIYRTEWILEEFDFCDSTGAPQGQSQPKGNYNGGYDKPPVDMGNNTGNIDAPF